jgi:hypothetical protein
LSHLQSQLLSQRDIHRPAEKFQVRSKSVTTLLSHKIKYYLRWWNDCFDCNKKQFFSSDPR